MSIQCMNRDGRSINQPSSPRPRPRALVWALGGALVAGAACEAPPSSSCELAPIDGWTDASSNCGAVQGAAWVDWRAESESYIRLMADGSALCVEGFQGMGAGDPGLRDVSFGLYLNQTSPTATAADYDAVEHGVEGFSFTLDRGTPLPYFAVESGGELYCAPVPEAGGHLTFRLTDLHAACWTDRPGGTPDARRLRSLAFYAGASEPAAFNSCVSALSVVPAQH
jgi:hypothetical protein